MTYRELYDKWHKDNNCEHVHCPDGCEHPQPILLDDGRMVCGRCLIIFNEFVEVEPCGPNNCGD